MDNSIRLFEALPRHPYVSTAFITRQLAVSKPTAGRVVEGIESAAILIETTGKRRDRGWAYQRYLDVLRVGTELEGV